MLGQVKDPSCPAFLCHSGSSRTAQDSKIPYSVAYILHLVFKSKLLLKSEDMKESCLKFRRCLIDIVGLSPCGDPGYGIKFRKGVWI